MWFKSECNRTSERLWDYVSQRLTTTETAQVEGHLQHCSQCQAEAEAYRQTIGMLGAARSMPVPASQTSWRDLRPGLTPERRPALRSADLLPRLTLAGAGTALAATLLVVFLSGGHHSGLSVAPSPVSSGQQRIVSSERSTPPVAVPGSGDQEVPDAAAPGSILDSFSGAPALLATTTSPAPTKQPSVSPFRLPAPHHRNYPRFARSGGRRGYNSPSVASAETDAQLDGGNVSPRAQQNYVLNPVSASSDDDTVRHYVISSIPASQNGNGMVASNDGADEGRAW
jgi:anti-sigma factor RsiW